MTTTETVPKGLVLVTGANGYIGARVVDAFLKAGYSVRGAVRSPKSGATLVSTLAHYTRPESSPRLEIAYVPDITAPDAFSEALKGVTAVAHLATPVTMLNSDVDYIINTSVNGTLSIANSALKEPSVKTFVLMSSIAAVVNYNEPKRYTEEDWNTVAEDIIEAKGAAAGGPFIYSASKVRAEREFWRFIKEKQPKFTATAINPTFVGGPPLSPPRSPEEISESNIFIWDIFSGKEFPAGPAGHGNYTDVRDVARLTLFGVENPEIANGQRYIVGGNGNFGNPQAVADILRKAYPERRNIIKEGTPGSGYLPDWAVPEGERVVISDKAVHATGQDWIPYDKMVLDAAKSFEALL